MKLNCPKCGCEFEMKNPITVKGGQVKGLLPTEAHKAKIGATMTKRWDAWRLKHGKTKVIRNRPGQPKLIPKKIRDDALDALRYTTTSPNFLYKKGENGTK